MSPKCLCQVEMLGVGPNLWRCPTCGRIVRINRANGYKTWYVPETQTCGCFNKLRRGD